VSQGESDGVAQAQGVVLHGNLVRWAGGGSAAVRLVEAHFEAGAAPGGGVGLLELLLSLGFLLVGLLELLLPLGFLLVGCCEWCFLELCITDVDADQVLEEQSHAGQRSESDKGMAGLGAKGEEGCKVE